MGVQADYKYDLKYAWRQPEESCRERGASLAPPKCPGVGAEPG